MTIHTLVTRMDRAAESKSSYDHCESKAYGWKSVKPGLGDQWVSGVLSNLSRLRFLSTLAIHIALRAAR